MFGKLLKYELRSVMKDFRFIWGGILLVSAVNAFTVGLGNEPISEGFRGFLLVALPLIVLFALYVAAFVVTVMYVLRRFWQGLLGNEGYLMFTLPVTAGQLIAAKALTALILEVVSALVALVGGLIILVVQVPADFWTAAEQIWQEALRLVREQPAVILMAVEVLVMMLLGACQTNLHLYTGMSLGHLAKKNRVAWSAAAVAGISIAVSTVSGWLGSAIGQVNIHIHIMGANNGVGYTAKILALACLVSLVLNVVYYCISRWILMNKLNLE